jgi:hypothetical protein
MRDVILFHGGMSALVILGCCLLARFVIWPPAGEGGDEWME